jgi:hypothetical protein
MLICSPCYCGTFKAPENGEVWPATGVWYGRAVNISCNSGVQVAGEGTRSPLCRADGDFALGSVCPPSDYALIWLTTLGAQYYLFYWYKSTSTDAEKALGLVVGNLALAASCVGCVLAYRVRTRTKVASTYTSLQPLLPASLLVSAVIKP